MVRVIEGRFQFRNDLRGSKNYFELTGGSSYRGFHRELPRVKERGRNKGFTVLNYFFHSISLFEWSILSLKEVVDLCSC